MAIEMPGMMRMTGHVSVTRGRTCDIAITSCLGVRDDDQSYLHRGDVEEDRYIPLSPGTPHTLRDTRTLILAQAVSDWFPVWGHHNYVCAVAYLLVCVSTCCDCPTLTRATPGSMLALPTR